MEQQTLLIVDDDADFADAVGAYLEANGYRILKAGNGRAGVSLARAERPDLILMDVMMEERTEGFFAVQELRRTPDLAETPIFVITSLYAVEDFRIAPDQSWTGHNEFFHKPVDVPFLLKRINARLLTPVPASATPD